MTIPVLVVDADEEYRNLTVKTLNGTGQYKAFPAETANTALHLLAETRAQIAIVDIDLPDADGVEVVSLLLQQSKHLLVIAVVDHENDRSQQLNDVGVRSILEKPFYLPELPMIIKSAVRGPTHPPKSPTLIKETPIEEEEEEIEVGVGIPHWLLDSDQASDFLTRLFQEHSAKALLLLRGTTLWARSSQLSEAQAKQIAMMLEDEREDNVKESIVRYIRMEGLEGDLLLYAIPVQEEYKLVLLYDSEKSFSIARRQAKYVSQLILTQDPSNLPSPETEAIVEETAVPTTQPQDSTLPGDWIPQSPASADDFPQLTDLDIPPADPEIGILDGAVGSSPIASELPPLPTDWFPKRPTPSSHLPFLAPDDLGEHSKVEGQVENADQHEARYHLPFSAVLIPFLQTHRLDDTLAKKVQNWVQDICIAWGLRADDVQTAPDYLRLTLNLSPDTAPSTAIHHLASALSKQILSTNPAFKEDLPSDQFWAKHYLLIAGEEIGAERIQTFVEATRQDPGTSPLDSD
jgi:DNA-binding response OmpR family regulator/REP element-mobilizing transposase RayT